MRILFLSQLIPYPLDAGPKVRAYYVLRHLAEAGHEVTLLAFSRESDSAASIDHLRQFCVAVHTVPMPRSRPRDAYHAARSLLTGQPFLIARDHVPEMIEKVKGLAVSEAFDAVHADQLWMAPCALAAWEAVVPPRPRLVLDQHNAVYLIPQRLAESGRGALTRWLLRREARLMRAYELDTLQKFDDVVWVTAEDRAAVALPEVGSPRQRVIPICVDPENTPPIRRASRPHRVTFLGGLHWPPNAAGIVWFAREVWPSVRAAAPELTLTVIGKSPPGELLSAAAEPGSRIEVTGYVDDPREYLAETAVFVVPLHAGGGMRVKIVEAWLWGLPIVSTTIGAEGILSSNGRDMLLADTTAAFVAAILRVVNEPGLADRLAESGRRQVEDHYDWSTEYASWDVIYGDAVLEQTAALVIG
ncbi:MAG TPA: glycosyltransferase family 4 protein [Promineifilum sp.]|nr:glycosyltransferase family 4 protein [Promineifilum sp.]HRQ11842.1 glycosyltransferase family 4 protein [Promineifilum sp.]